MTDTQVITRRRWLRLVAGGAMVAAIAGGLAWKYRQLRLSWLPIMQHEQAMITRIVDLLVPRDETPGALDLGVHRLVISELSDNRTRAKGFAEALLDLDRHALAEHGAEFLELNATLQETLLLTLAAAPRRTPGGRFIRLLRYDTMRHYYARPEVWPSLGFDGPPQPRGFIDYTQPPRPRF